MPAQRSGPRRQLILGVPALLVIAVIALGACATAGGNIGKGAPLSTTIEAPDPFWQTATARVAAVRFPAQPILRPFDAPSPTPTTAAIAATTPDTATNDASALAAPLASTAVPVRSGSQLLDRTFVSAALGREMHYFIYLPPGYAESGMRYPVLYMLHGYGGSNTEWIAYGLPETEDKMINAGQIPPMILVLPQGDQAYWVNHADDGERWGDYTAQDVVRQIDATYRTIPDAAHRAIGGLSMGAHGALQLAMTEPGIFGVVGMHSPTLRDYQSMSDFVGFFGDESYFDAHDPIHLVQAHPEQARQLKILVDVGEQDTEWHDRTVAFHDLLTQLAIPHQFQTWPGVHDGAYWGGHVADYLRFYAAALSG
jgi:enterochelin esterase-like enzyme